MAKPQPFWETLPSDQRAAWQEDWDERAAILEYDAGMTRQKAEREAYRLVRAKWAGTH